MLYVIAGKDLLGHRLRITRTATGFYDFAAKVAQPIFLCGVPTEADESPICRPITTDEREILERVAAAFRPAPPLEDILGEENTERRRLLLL